MSDLGILLLTLGGAVVAALLVCFLWGFTKPFIPSLRAMRGSGPLAKEDAHMLYGTSLLLWRLALLSTALTIGLWYAFEFMSGRVAAAVAILLLGFGWYVRNLGVRRMRSSLQGGGFGPRHLRE